MSKKKRVKGLPVLDHRGKWWFVKLTDLISWFNESQTLYFLDKPHKMPTAPIQRNGIWMLRDSKPFAETIVVPQAIRWLSENGRLGEAERKNMIEDHYLEEFRAGDILNVDTRYSSMTGVVPDHPDIMMGNTG